MITTMAGSTARRKHNVMHLKNNYTSKCTSTSTSLYVQSCKILYIYNLQSTCTSTIYRIHRPHSLSCARMMTITLSLSGCQAWSKASSRREREVTRNR